MNTKHYFEIKKLVIVFCKKLLIKYEESLQRSTFFNKQWWGDSISKKYLNGLNPNFKNSFNKKFFYEKDISILEKKLYTIMKKLIV